MREDEREASPLFTRTSTKEDAVAKKAEAKKGARPDFIARARQTPDSEFMATIGAAWAWKEGTGFVVKLSLIPTNWDGSFILAEPKADDENK